MAHRSSSRSTIALANDANLKDFVTLQADFADSDHSWSIDAHAIDARRGASR
jgi:hypothetical protein